MIPYSGLFFFYIASLLLVPAIALGLHEKPIKKYALFANILMIFLIFQSSLKQSICLIAFYCGEIILVKGYLVIRKKFNQRWILWIVLLLSISPLILVKWGNILIHREVGFIGISYLTFKVIQILIETYDGIIKEISLSDFTYFVLFFPTISSGPIDRSRRFTEDSNKILTKQVYTGYLREGIWKLFKGVSYKFVIGTIISTYWVNKIPSPHTLINTLNYMYGYSFYLFFDFAGYSLMAVGMSYILGIKTPDNFNMPFISKDIKDFWNRWHMSLSFWFRDFVYTRFVMASIKKKWFKSRYTASYIGFIITMSVMGLWHGTQKYYIIYGIYHGLLIVLTDLFERKSKWYKKVKNNDTWNIIFTFVTFNFVCFGFLIFSGYLFNK